MCPAAASDANSSVVGVDVPVDVEHGIEASAAATDDSGARFKYEIPERVPYPAAVAWFRRNAFTAFVTIVFLGTFAWLAMQPLLVVDLERHAFVRSCKLFSVPLVSLLFTWFHVWLALQMMFYPIAFWGLLPSRPIVPTCVGIPINGWQGIVPRKANIMAQRAAKAMIGNIVTIEEFMERVQPDDFFEHLEKTMACLTSEVLERVACKRWPTFWNALPEAVQRRLKLKVLAETRQCLGPAIGELKQNINTILNLQEMCVDLLTERPELLVDMFRSVATREICFIQHLAAVMGFVLGIAQVALYVTLDGTWEYTDYVMLPMSGLIIGYLTNWLALNMTFRPVWPHMLCGNRINIQGVFLKRQKEAAAKMAELICHNVVDTQAMFKYVLRGSSPGLNTVLEIYQRHIDQSVDETIGVARHLAPSFTGHSMEDIKKDVVDISLELLPQHTGEIERYIDEKLHVEATLSWRLARLTPPEFKEIVHPIFQDDEWILLLVGGLLGVIIGLLQAYALQHIS